jgi:hypothetical protein
MRCVNTIRLSLAPLLVSMLSVPACGGDDGDTGFTHLFDAKPYAQGECNTTDQRLATRREMHLFTHDIDVPSYTRSLQRYYRRHGLEFFTNQPVQSVDLNYVLDANSATLMAALTKDFPGVDLNDETLATKDPALYDRLIKAVMNFLFHPAIEFAAKYGKIGTGITNLILLPKLLSPGSDDLFPVGGEVAGLAISPALIASFVDMNSAEGASWKQIDLPPDFTPMMFLDGQVLGSIASSVPDLVDLVTAHEFGHTMGLVHRQSDSHNLMFPSVDPRTSTCLDGLDDDQFATMQKTLGIGTPQALVRAGAGIETLRQMLPPTELTALLRGDRAAMRNLIRHFIN